MEAIFFNGWFTLLRTAVVGILAYAALVLFAPAAQQVPFKGTFQGNDTVSPGPSPATALLSTGATGTGTLRVILAQTQQAIQTESDGGRQCAEAECPKLIDEWRQRGNAEDRERDDENGERQDAVRIQALVSGPSAACPPPSDDSLYGRVHQVS